MGFHVHIDIRSNNLDASMWSFFLFLGKLVMDIGDLSKRSQFHFVEIAFVGFHIHSVPLSHIEIVLFVSIGTGHGYGDI